MVAPVTVFSLLFDASVVTQGFIRLGGSLLTLFGIYYLGAAIGCQRGVGLKGFYTSTVIGRIFVAGLCFVLFVSKEIAAGILFFGMMNLVGALMMIRALKKDESA
jgi:hypothetical protein